MCTFKITSTFIAKQSTEVRTPTDSITGTHIFRRIINPYFRQYKCSLIEYKIIFICFLTPFCSGSGVTFIYIVSVVVGIIPITIFIYFWVLVSRFYQEIQAEENELANFAKQNTNARIIKKFMTKDEYDLSKRNLKINARGFKENKILNRYI